MTLVLILLLGLAIGAVLGGLGGGGAVLTVPALVYLVGQPAQAATTSSLVIVGLTAVVGVASYVSSRRVAWRVGAGIAVAGIPAAFAGSYLNHRVDEDHLLIGFSVLMVIAAVAMVARRTAPDDGPAASDVAGFPPEPERGDARSAEPGGRAVVTAATRATPTGAAPGPSWLGIVAAGLAVGVLTGFFGVGGGFVIVPALVVVLGLPMEMAVGTSLLVVAANSATSLVARVGTAHFDWSVVIPFTVAAMVATLLGKKAADRLPARQLKKGFAVLLVLVAAYTAWQSVSNLTAQPARSTQSQATSVPVSTVQAVRDELAAGAVLIDVRTPAEYATGHLTGALNIDLAQPSFSSRIETLDPSAHYIVYCATGRRAATAVQTMRDLGIDRLTNGGGYDRLRDAGIPAAT